MNMMVSSDWKSPNSTRYLITSGAKLTASRGESWVCSTDCQHANLEKGSGNYLPRPVELSWDACWVDMLSAWDDKLWGDNCSCFITGNWPVVQVKEGETVGRWRDAYFSSMEEVENHTRPSKRVHSPTFLWSIQDSPICEGGIFPWSKTWAGLCNWTGVPWRKNGLVITVILRVF